MAVESWNGVVRKLQSVFSARSGVCDRDVQVVPAAAPEEFELEMQKKGMRYELPVIVATPVSFDPNDSSYNKHVLRRDGQPMQIDEGREWWVFFRAMPTTITFQVMLVTDDVLTMLRMAERWMSNETWGFTLAFDNMHIKIKVQPDKNLSVPSKSPSTGGGDQYRLTTNLKVETYAGYAWLIPSIRKAQLEVLFPMGTLADALAAGTVDGVAVFSRTAVSSDPIDPSAMPAYEPTF